MKFLKALQQHRRANTKKICFDNEKTVDVCIVVEGAYPYVVGGVSGWLQDLIENLPELTFHVIAIKATDDHLAWRVRPPKNVTGVTEIALTPRRRPPGNFRSDQVDRVVSEATNFLHRGGMATFKSFLASLASLPGNIEAGDILSHEQTFKYILSEYKERYPKSSFHHFFWASQALLGGLISVGLAPLPNARCYHSISTGFAGLLTSRASIERQRPACLTEHGIYLLERQIEILMSNWIGNQVDDGLTICNHHPDLRDFWQSAFINYAQVCYDSCVDLIALYQANNDVQMRLGACPTKLLTIPNGIDASRFLNLQDSRDPERPIVALLGRVVPIKDIKTFVRAANAVHQRVPSARFVILGPLDEDPEYARECEELVEMLPARHAITFAGRVNIHDWMPKIDLLVLTSLSEAQPLVILEGGACGIPVVAPDVGSCKEMIEGRSGDILPGGIITPLVNPEATAEAIIRILTTPGLRNEMGGNLKARVIADYDHGSIISRYRELYVRRGDMNYTPL